MKTIVPAILATVVLLFGCWRVHQDKAKRLHGQDKVEIVVYNPDGIIIQPTAHRR
jgi:hypothetical protein